MLPNITVPFQVERASHLIWQMVDEKGQDALSHYDYADIIAYFTCGKQRSDLTAVAREYVDKETRDASNS